MDGAGRAAPIIETVVTTLNPDGSVNCGAMGVEWGAERIVIKPFRGTRTLRNLRATGAAVVHLTDDLLLFSQAALGDPHPPTHPAAAVAGAVLDDACSWREVRVEAIDDSGRRWSTCARSSEADARRRPRTPAPGHARGGRPRRAAVRRARGVGRPPGG